MSKRAPGSADPLPRQLDIRKLAMSGATVQAVEPLAVFPRVMAQLLSAEGMVQIELVFSSDDQRRCIILGHVQTTVQVPCQRCLQAMTLEVDSRFRVGVVESDEAARQLPRDLEPYVVGQEPQALHDLVEDELLLSLPYTSYHDEAECSVQSRYSTGEAESDAVASRVDNPFQQLGQLKPGKSDH